MRKTKLLLVALLAMLGLSVNAQSWTAPTIQIQGEDPVDGETYKVMNVGAVKYLAEGRAWFGWSTTAILADNGKNFTFQGDASSFILITERDGNNKVFTSGNGITGDAMHVDGANATNYGFTKMPSGFYRIHDAGGNADSPCWGYNSEFHPTGIVAHADATAEGWMCEWAFLKVLPSAEDINLYNAKLNLYNMLNTAYAEGVNTDAASAVYNNASATIDELNQAYVALKIARVEKFVGDNDDVDVTELTIVNPSFETGDTRGWTYEPSNDHGAKANSNGTYTISNADGDYVFNIWASGNAISQTINLPKGEYKLTALIATDAGNQVKLFAKDKSVNVNASEEGKGVGVEGEVDFTVLDGTATIGAEGVNKVWYKVDNFRLTLKHLYTDQEFLEAAQQAYDEAFAAAMAIDISEDMETAVKNALEEAIDASYDIDDTDIDALTAAAALLQTAADNAAASIAAYAEVPAKLEAMEKLIESTNVYTEEALEEYYSKWVVKYEDGTLTTEEANALQNPYEGTGWHASIMCDDFLLSAWDTNPNFQNAPYYINTWSVEGNNDGSEFRVPFFEYWTGDGDSLGERTLTATMNNLPAGEYIISAWVRVRAKNGTDALEATGITLQANDGEAVDVTEGEQVGESQFNIGVYGAVGTVGEDGVLKIKFIVAADNNISWLSFKDVTFELVPETVEIEIGESGYATFVSTKNLDFSDSDIKAYTAKVSDDYVVLTEIQQVKAGTPVVLIGETDDVDVMETAPAAAANNDLKAGTGAAVATEGNGVTNYILSTVGGTTAFYYAAGKVVATNRAYLPVANGSESRLSIVFADQATGITSVDASKVAIDGIYNLNGQRVVKAQKGLYIQNGKKVMVK